MAPSTIPFQILWPGGNTTALVEIPIASEDRAQVASTIMKEYPEIEQVGFLQTDPTGEIDVQLQMMGGEFCGNATRSTAFYWANKIGKDRITLRTSGIDELIPAFASPTDSSVHLPLSLIQNIDHVDENSSIVELKGITHILCWAEPNEQLTQELIKDYKHLPAVGVIYAREEGNTVVIDPYVYVRDTDTLIHETSCGSGSIALAAVLNDRSSESSFTITQPTGKEIIVKFVGDYIILAGDIEHRGTKEVRMDA